MTSTLSAWKSHAPAVNLKDGTFNQAFLKWLQQELGVRTGGVRAMTNLELAEAVQSLIVGEMVFQPTPADALLPDILQSAPSADLGEMTWQI